MNKFVKEAQRNSNNEIIGIKKILFFLNSKVDIAAKRISTLKKSVEIIF